LRAFTPSTDSSQWTWPAQKRAPATKETEKAPAALLERRIARKSGAGASQPRRCRLQGGWARFSAAAVTLARTRRSATSVTLSRAVFESGAGMASDAGPASGASPVTEI
jgi:hypothetical protein